MSEIPQVQNNRKLEVPSDVPSVKSDIYNYLEINEKENEHNLEMSCYARK